MAMVGYAAPCVLLANLIASLSGPSASLYLWSSTKPAPYMLAYRMRAPGSAALATIHALTTFFFAVAMSPRRNAAIPCSPIALDANGAGGAPKLPPLPKSSAPFQSRSSLRASRGLSEREAVSQAHAPQAVPGHASAMQFGQESLLRIRCVP